MRTDHDVSMAALLPAATSTQPSTVLGAMVSNVLCVRLCRLVGSWRHARFSLQGHLGQTISCGSCAAQRGRCDTVSAGAICRQYSCFGAMCASFKLANAVGSLTSPSTVFTRLQAAHGVSRLGAAVLCGITTVNMDGRGVRGEGRGLPVDAIRTPTARASPS